MMDGSSRGAGTFEKPPQHCRYQAHFYGSRQMPSGPEGYLVGRGSVPFTEKGDPITDKMIAAQRLDDRVLKSRCFDHCTFANVSFKEAQLTDSEFNDFAFVN